MSAALIECDNCRIAHLREDQPYPAEGDSCEECEDAADELAALRAEVERLKRIEELALIWSAYQFDSRRALHQQADDAAIALLDALDSDKVAARLDAAKRCADPTTGSRDV